MLHRFTAQLLILTIAVAPMVCCGNGFGLIERQGVCHTGDGCCDASCGQGTESPRPQKNCPCDEDCQCVCAGAVLSGSWNAAMLKAAISCLSLAAWDFDFGRRSSRTGWPDLPPPDSDRGLSGRSMRVLHESLLC